MSYPRALKKRGLSPRFWALGLFLVFMNGCGGCSKKAASPPLDEECKTIEQNSVANNRLLQIFTDCRGKNGDDTPVLYAHVLQQTLKDEVCIEDIMANTGGRHFCAPGPFKIDDGSSVDVADKLWTLEQIPDYFVWHIGSVQSVDENLLITNQNGFPIKSQTFKLQNEGDTILVLLPNKNAMTNSGRYFIYLTRNAKDAQRMWIQPVSSIAHNAAK